MNISVPVHWESRVHTLEAALLGFAVCYTFKFPLPDKSFLLWSRRFDKKWHLIYASIDADRGHFNYCPFSESGEYIIEKYSPKIPDFLAQFLHYCELPYLPLW